MKHKDEVQHEFRNFEANCRNQKGATVKILRSDGGGEYVGRDFQQFLKNRGMEHQRSAPFVSQQNGRSERSNRTLMIIIRCLMIQSGVTDQFWAEALKTACYLKNICPSSAIEGEIPAELWNGEKLKLEDFDKVKTFVCQPWAYVSHRRKFEAKAEECILLGPEDGVKGYRL